jgi:hypothetical protein
MLLKILYELWPFIKEIFAGESDISKAIRRNKLSTLLFMVNVSLFCLLIYITDQMITRQKETKVTLNEVYTLRDELEECKNKPIKTKHIVVETPIPQKVIHPEPQPQPAPPVDLNSKLDGLRKEEYMP